MQMIQHTGSYLFKQIVTQCKSSTYYILSTWQIVSFASWLEPAEEKQNNSALFPLKYALSSILIHSYKYTFGHLDV